MTKLKNGKGKTRESGPPKRRNHTSRAYDDRVTTKWRNPSVSRPEQGFLGTQYEDYIDRRQAQSDVGYAFPLVVRAADHWAFRDTGAWKWLTPWSTRGWIMKEGWWLTPYKAAKEWTIGVSYTDVSISYIAALQRAVGVWGATEQNAELRILFQIQSLIKSGVSNLRYGRSLER